MLRPACWHPPSLTGSLLAEIQNHKESLCWLSPWDLEDLGRRQGRIMVTQLHEMSRSILDTGVALKRLRERKGGSEGLLFHEEHLKCHIHGCRGRHNSTCLLCTHQTRLQARREASPGHRSFARRRSAGPLKCLGSH